MTFVHSVAEKVQWVREEVEAMAMRAKLPVLQFSIYLCRVNDASRTGSETVSSFVVGLVDPLALRTPAVLVGASSSVEAWETRAVWLSYFNLGETSGGVAPIVALGGYLTGDASPTMARRRGALWRPALHFECFVGPSAVPCPAASAVHADIIKEAATAESAARWSRS